MRFLKLILNNWWLLVVLYGIWRSITKKSAALQRQAATPARPAAVVDARAGDDEDYAASATGFASTADTSEDSDFAEAETVPTATVYTFTDPAADEEREEAPQRAAAFRFTQEKTALQVEDDRTFRQSLDAVYAPLAEDQPVREGWTFSPEQLRRAIVMNEILRPPRAYRRSR